ncbi:hypothetical protein JIR23_06560 [Bradyrhizobium diazoefficiens]|nr:hypothetical protein [Bradyrhizobium diazoefficiens]QQN65423.1 hypothetical protein JIR23_06560 [Bradyrhizobium diazoefficiens]
MNRQTSWRNAIYLCVRRSLRLVLHDETGHPGPPAVVGEAEEGEGLGPPLAAPLAREGREPTKLDQPSCPHDKVIGVAHEHYTTAMRQRSLVGPEIKDVVQEDAGKERAHARSLRRALSVSCFSL